VFRAPLLSSSFVLPPPLLLLLQSQFFFFASLSTVYFPIRSKYPTYFYIRRLISSIIRGYPVSFFRSCWLQDFLRTRYAACVPWPHTHTQTSRVARLEVGPVSNDALTELHTETKLSFAKGIVQGER
jgi:hypothetical protein